MNNLMRTLTVLTLFLTCIIPLFAWAADDVPGGYYLKYSVSDRDVTVVAAVTPYDSDPQVKEAFLNWFKRGFETVLKGKPPLMIEWGVTAAANAGREGYDFGMDEAERYLKKEKGSTQSLYVVPIPYHLPGYGQKSVRFSDCRWLSGYASASAAEIVWRVIRVRSHASRRSANFCGG